MKIVADQNIPLLKEFFSDSTHITTLPGREITRQSLLDCDALLVRSVSRVNQDLLHNTRVSFVGSCTIGLDHIDTTYLDQKGISWANAPGCNADGVVQYVFSVLAQLLPGWQGKTVGIVGCGNIGKRLYERFSALGMEVCCYDPLLSPDLKDRYKLVGFDQVLEADIISCHTPLTDSGPYPTRHLFDRKAFAAVKAGALLINSCRGGVFDEAALLSAIELKKLKVALDVWEGEPALDYAVLDAVDIATPHIAGYTLEGRQNGTAMVYQAFCRHFGLAEKDPAGVLTLDTVSASKQLPGLDAFLLDCYPVIQDDDKLRQARTLANPGDFPARFDALRKNYPHRREYSHYQLPTSTGFWQAANIIRGE